MPIMPECFLAVEHGNAVPFSRRISSGHIRAGFTGPANNSKRCRTNLMCSSLSLPTKWGVPPQVIERGEPNRLWRMVQEFRTGLRRLKPQKLNKMRVTCVYYIDIFYTYI